MSFSLTKMDYQNFIQSEPYGPSQEEMMAKYKAGIPIFRSSDDHGNINYNINPFLALQNQGMTGGLSGQQNIGNPSARLVGQVQIKKEINNIEAAMKALGKPNLPIKSKEKHMFGFAKEYLEKHKDTVMTVVVALLVDHFFLGGALREKIKALTESILDNAQKKLSHTPSLENKDATKSAS